MDTSSIERALGAIGSAFRLTRLYPATHPAVTEAMRQVATSLPGLAAQGSLEWKVGATGLHWQGQHLLPRNSQLSEIAGLLYARGVRSVQLHPGATSDQIIALFGVATGNVQPDDASLGRITLILGRRQTQRLSAIRASEQAPAPAPAPAPAAPAPEPPPVAPTPPPAAANPPVASAPAPVPAAPMPPPAPPPPPPPPPAPAMAAPPAAPAAPVAQVAPSASMAAFRGLPPDVEAKRIVAALGPAEPLDARRAGANRLLELVPQLLALRDLGTVAEIIAGLDRALAKTDDNDLGERIGAAAGALADQSVVERMVARLGEPRVPPNERAVLVGAVGALAALSTGLVLERYLNTPAEMREPYRAAIRAAGERAVEPLEARLQVGREDVVAAAAEFLGLTGAPQVVALLVPLLRHRAEQVREAALHGLAEIGGREIARPAIPSLKDESVVVRIAAARAVGVGGDTSAGTVLLRRLDHETDEGVLAELLRAVGRLGPPEALAVLAKHAEPGSMMKRRSVLVRVAAIEGLSHIRKPEARALVELYGQDKDTTVRRAAEAALR
jgi:HEAT repeat protein